MSSHFPLFEGPIGEMAYRSEQPSCDLCGRTTDLSFRLKYAHVPELEGNPHKKSAAGCHYCLRSGRFLVGHDTPYGLLRADQPDRPWRFYNHHQSFPRSFDRGALATLLRTPDFSSWQQSIWLTHCNTFMAYLGEWHPSDFLRSSPDGNARAQFRRMTRRDLDLWDETFPEGTITTEDWYIAYYAFRCLQCNKLRGYYDFP